MRSYGARRALLRAVLTLCALCTLCALPPSASRADAPPLDRAMWALGALGAWAQEAARAPLTVEARAWVGGAGDGAWEAEGARLSLLDGAATIEADRLRVAGGAGVADGLTVRLHPEPICARQPASAACQVARWSPTLHIAHLSWGDAAQAAPADAALSVSAQGVTLSVRPCDPDNDPDSDPSAAAAQARTHTLSAQAATWRPNVLTLEGARISPCVCDDSGKSDPGDPGGAGLGLALTVTRWIQPLPDPSADPSTDPLAAGRGEGARLEALGESWPVWGGEVGADGRASGLLWPRLGYSGAMGWYVSAPVFWRLGDSADLTTSLGWASALGVTADATGRWAFDDASVGALTVGGALGVSPWDARGWWRGAGRAQWGGAALIVEADGVSDWALHWATARDLEARAKRYGRSRLGAGLDADTLSLWLVIDLLQALPRDAARVGGAPSAGFGADAPTWHRLPWASLGWWARLRPWLRWELDTDYVYGRRFGGAGFADWGDQPWAGALGWWPDASASGLGGAGAGDTTQSASEPYDRAHLMGLRAALLSDASLGGYARLSVAAALTERLTFHDDPSGPAPDGQVSLNRASALSVGASLDTTLLRRSAPATAHLLEPSLTWRWVPITTDSAGLRGPGPWTWRAPAPLSQTLEAATTARWLSPTWRLTARVGALAAFDDTLRADLGCPDWGCPWLLADARLEALALGLDLRAAAHVTLDEGRAPAARASALWRAPWGLRLGASHALASAAPLWLDASPSDGLPASPWRRLSAPEAATPDGTHTALSGALLGWRAASWGADAALHWAWQTDPDAAATLSADLSPACQCWRVTLSGTRHLTAPRWDASLSLSLDLNP